MHVGIEYTLHEIVTQINQLKHYTDSQLDEYRYDVMECYNSLHELAERMNLI